MANPIVSRTELAIGSTPMTVKGVIQKTSFLLGLTTVSALGFFFYILNSAISMSMVNMITIASAIIGFGLVMAIMFKPAIAKSLAAPYAILEGLFLGGISLRFAGIDPSIPTNALAATFITAAIMLGLYKSGMIKVTDKFRSIIMSAMLSIVLVYVVQFVMSFFFSSSLPSLFSGGLVSIGFTLFVIVIASFTLLLDFDNIERSVAARVSEEYEWVFSVSMVVSLVWMYVEFMRLLSYLND